MHPAAPAARIATMLVIALCAGAALSACQRQTASAPGQPMAAAPTTGGGVFAPAAPQLQPIANGPCHGLVPAGWGIGEQNPQGTIFGLTAPDGHASGEYGIEPIGAAMPNGGAAAMARLQQIAPYLHPPALPPGASGAQYATPMAAMQFTIRQLFGQNAQIMQSPQPDALGNTVLVFSGAQKHGQLAFTPYADGQGNTSVVMRIAAVNNGVADTELAAAVAVANSVSCQVQLQRRP